MARSLAGKKTSRRRSPGLRRWRSHTTRCIADARCRDGSPRCASSVRPSPRFCAIGMLLSVASSPCGRRTACARIGARVGRRSGSSDLHDAARCRTVDNGDRPVPRSVPRKGESALDYTEVLRRLAINDEHFAEECVTGVGDRLAQARSEDAGPGPHRRAGGGRRRGSILRSGGRRRGECGCDGRRDRLRCWSASFPSSGSPVLSQRRRVSRWRLGTTSTMPWNSRSGVRDLSATRRAGRLVVARCTASLREETPSFR